MGKQHRQYSAAFKFKVALEAAKGSKTLSELASEMEVHPIQISDWKRRLPRSISRELLLRGWLLLCDHARGANAPAHAGANLGLLRTPDQPCSSPQFVLRSSSS
jgi:transposase-like protein